MWTYPRTILGSLLARMDGDSDRGRLAGAPGARSCACARSRRPGRCPCRRPPSTARWVLPSRVPTRPISVPRATPDRPLSSPAAAGFAARLPGYTGGSQGSRPEEGSLVTIAIIVGVCVVLAVLAFLLPRLSRHPQRGVDRTLGV